ncbi:uncharacterized protein BDZ99DRAFT_514164 [Mytilinidion resinicola]|uniref:Uncharacterized protein n=1 Tax=Mytilinidion resinicola TaxID=574789 RepID=A0A6A6ZCA2_9PEZI|nr:uncharacterized protein BDZ99DRAFT_514164 [Mytilinidion resinicola]KAF2817944.1 hypothetical protein BDZ99DRAFT_514164 [Mytilinidion resinicola]
MPFNIFANLLQNGKAMAQATREGSQDLSTGDGLDAKGFWANYTRRSGRHSIIVGDAHTPDEDLGNTAIEDILRTTNSPYLFDVTNFLKDESYRPKLCPEDDKPARGVMGEIITL